LTNISRFDLADSAISGNDANQKPGASQWLKSFSDKISPKLKSKFSSCLGYRLPEKLECLRFRIFLKLQVFLHMLIKKSHFSSLLSSLISDKFKGIFCLATSPASALNLHF
jgi:hypothetical protein